MPILYKVFNVRIRQPIGGEYAFDLKYINLVLREKIYPEIFQYGIDIFMVILVLKYGIKYSQVKLGKKIHAPSYNKMEKIFLEVSKSLKLCLLNCNYVKYKDKLYLYNSLYSKSKCDFYEEMILNNKYIFEKNNIKIDDFKTIEKLWLDMLIEYINKDIYEVDYEYMKDMFKCYTLSFWYTFFNKNSRKCEKQIWNLANKLKRKKGNNEFDNR